MAANQEQKRLVREFTALYKNFTPRDVQQFMSALDDFHAGTGVLVLDYVVKQASYQHEYADAIRGVLRCATPLRDRAALITFLAAPEAIHVAHMWKLLDYPIKMETLLAGFAKRRTPLVGFTDSHDTDDATATVAAIRASLLRRGVETLEPEEPEIVKQRRAAAAQAIEDAKPILHAIAPLRPAQAPRPTPEEARALVAAAKTAGFPPLDLPTLGDNATEWLSVEEAQAAGIDLQRFGHVSPAPLGSLKAGAGAGEEPCPYEDLYPVDPNHRVRFDAGCVFKFSADHTRAALCCLHCYQVKRLQPTGWGQEMIERSWAAQLEEGEPGLPDVVPGFEGQPWTSRNYCEALYTFTRVGANLLPARTPAVGCVYKNMCSRVTCLSLFETTSEWGYNAFRLGWENTSKFAYKVSADGQRACMSCVRCGNTHALYQVPEERATRGVLPLWGGRLGADASYTNCMPWMKDTRGARFHSDMTDETNILPGDPTCRHPERVYICDHFPVDHWEEPYAVEGCPRCGWMQEVRYRLHSFN